jgi:hypothetical protein
MTVGVDSTPESGLGSVTVARASDRLCVARSRSSLKRGLLAVASSSGFGLALTDGEGALVGVLARRLLFAADGSILRSADMSIIR